MRQQWWQRTCQLKRNEIIHTRRLQYILQQQKMTDNVDKRKSSAYVARVLKPIPRGIGNRIILELCVLFELSFWKCPSRIVYQNRLSRINRKFLLKLTSRKKLEKTFHEEMQQFLRLGFLTKKGIPCPARQKKAIYSPKIMIFSIIGPMVLLILALLNFLYVCIYLLNEIMRKSCVSSHGVIAIFLPSKVSSPYEFTLVYET